MLWIIILLILSIVTLSRYRLTRQSSSSSTTLSRTKGGALIPPVVAENQTRFLGHAIAYATDPVRLLSAARRKYGDAFTIRVVNRSITWILDEEFRKFYARSDDDVLNLFKVMDLFGIDRVFGKHRAKEDWDHARVVRQRIMHQKLIADVSQLYPLLISESFHHLDALLDTNTDTIDLYSDEFRGITIARMTAAVFIAPEAARNQKLLNLVVSQYRRVNTYIKLCVLTPSWLADLLTSFAIDRFHNEFYAELRPIIQQRRDSISRKKKIQESDDLSMLDQLIESANPDGSKWSDQFIALQLSTFFFGAFVNTANALCLAVALVASDAEVRRQLQQELDSLLKSSAISAKGGFSGLKPEVLLKSAWLDACVKETLRLGAPLFGTARITEHDIPWRDKVIPAGELVAISPYFTHHDEKIFVDANRFDPRRWMDGFSLPLHTFGGGKHMCLGRQLAVAELKVALALMVTMFDVVAQEPMVLDYSQPNVAVVKGKTCKVRYAKRY